MSEPSTGDHLTRKTRGTTTEGVVEERPDNSGDELEHTRWTASLQNWGHDPLSG